MAEIAALAIGVDSSQVRQATAALHEVPKAAADAGRAAQKLASANDNAARSADEFSKRVKRTIADLKFQEQQLARTSAEQARYAALKRAGVAAASAEGIEITAGVRALQAQKAAYAGATERAEAFRKAKAGVGIAVALASAAMIAFVKRTFDVAASLDETAEQVGLTAKAFQALQFAASQNGVKVEQLETALGKFSQKMGEAAEGSKEMVESLTKLGVKNLDFQGKLRPTEDLLVDVAKAITAIEDPARRSAAAVDFFGKSGTKLLPVLSQIAGGTDAMAQAAQLAGVMIGGDTSKKLDVFADDLTKLGMRARAWAAEMMGATLDAIEAFRQFDERVTAQFKDWVKNLVASVSGFADGIAVEAARASAMFLEAFRQAPEQLRKVFVDMWNNAKAATATGINDITAYIANSKLGKLLGIEGTNLKGDPSPGGGADFSGLGDRISAAGRAAADRIAAEQKAFNDAAAVIAAQSAAGGIQGRAAPRGPYLSPSAAATIGRSTSAIKANGSAAEDAEKKYAKLVSQLELTADAQDKMTAASLKGDVQFRETKIQLEAQQKALDIYGKVLDVTNPKVKAIADLLTRIANGKAAEAFNVATTELQKQNVILEAQIRLMNEAPEIQAREIALIKAKQELEKTGLQEGTDAYNKMFDARRAAIEQNETLKIQQEELKRSQELWTAPLKRALEDIQSTAADAFAEILESGKFNFEALGQVFKKIIIRMAAEFLALATVRPVMSVILNAVSPGMAQQMGVGGGSSGGMFGGFGSGISDFLGKQVFGGPSGIDREIANWSTYGSANQNSMSGGGLTWGGALGGAASMGMGAYSMLSGKGGIGGMLGGGASMLGGGLSMLGPLLGVSSLGPIGMGIGLLGSLAPMLLEGLSPKPQPKTNRAYGEVIYGTGDGWQTSSGSWGGDSAALTGPLGEMTKSMDSIYDQLGGVTDATKVWGVALQSVSKVSSEGTAGGWDFNQQTSFLVGPNGERTQWGQGDDPGLEQAGVAATLKSILEGAVSDVSDNMRKALATVNQNGKDTFEILSGVVTEIKNFDTIMEGLGKTVTDAETGLKAIDDQFKILTDTAEKYGLDVAKVEEEQTKARAKFGTDFADAIQRELDDMLDPSKGMLADLDKARQSAIDNNKYIVDNVTDSLDQINKIEELYGKKRAEIVEAANAAMVQTAVNAWQTVPELARGQYLFTQSQALKDQLQALNDDTAAVSADPMATQIKAWQKESADFTKGVGDVFGTDSIEFYDASVAAFENYNAKMTAANDDFIDGMNAMLVALDSPGAANMGAIMEERAAAIQKAIALDGPYFDGILRVGPALEAALTAMNAKVFKVTRDFAYSISQGLLEFSDPLQAQLNDLNKERDEALKTAKANNAALAQISAEAQARADAIEGIRTSSLAGIEQITSAAAAANRAITDVEQVRIAQFQSEVDAAKSAAEQVGSQISAIGGQYVSLLDVTELYLKREAALKEQFYAQSLSALDEVIKRLTYGDLSMASPGAMLAGTRGAYEASLAQVRSDPNNQAYLQALATTSAEYIDTQKRFDGGSENYFDIAAGVRTALQSVVADIRGGWTSSGTNIFGNPLGAPANGNTLDPNVVALMQTIQSGQAQSTEDRKLLAEYQRLTAELLNEVKRLVSGRQ